MPIDLDKLERLEREATPGPWRLKRRAFEYNIFAVVIDFSSDLEAVHGLNLCRISELDRDGESNLDLLIALRNAAPALIAELRAARERIAELEDPSKVDPDLLQMAMRIAAGHADSSDAWALLEEVERLRGQVAELERLRGQVAELEEHISSLECIAKANGGGGG